MVTSGNSKLSIPTFIPLVEAVRIYNLTEDVLTRLIQDGRIEAAQLPSGELLVSDESLNEKTKEQIIEKEFGHLVGRPIRLSDAARKYRLSTANLSRWATANYIEIIEQEAYNTQLDEADVAYCAKIYHERKKHGGTFGTRLFDKDGNPYRLKHPELAKLRRKKN